MKYGNEEKTFGADSGERGCCAPMEGESLTGLLKDTGNIAFDVLAMSRKINDHMFGIGNPICAEKESSPKCFRDELEKMKANLLAAAEELSRIMARIGM